MFRLRTLYALIIFSASLTLFAQRGNYFVQNYLPANYQSAANNWGIVQDNDGVMFVANNNGVLIFDGINWTHCNRPDEATIFCIEKTARGEIVVGASDGDVALIKKNKRGKYIYVSLADKLPSKDRPQEIIRQIVTLGSSTYFLSSDRLVQYTNGILKAYAPTESFHTRMMIMGKHLYVTDVNNHLCVLLDGKLIPLENSVDLSSEKHFFCYPLNDSIYAIGYRNKGIYLAHYNFSDPTHTRFEKKNSSSDQDLNSSEITNGCILKNGNFVVTTNKSGAFELDKNLNIIHKFDSRTGIADDNIKAAYQDMNGNLWLSLYYGVAFVEINSRLYTYGRNNSIAGLVQSAVYFENKLFIGTDKGVQYYDSLQQKFLPFLNFNKQMWDLLNYDNKLFMCTAKGLFVYLNGQIQQISETNTHCIYADPFKPDIIYTGTIDGAEVYLLNANSVEYVKSYPMNSAVRSIASDSYRNVYFATSDKGIYFLNENSTALDSVKEKDGLPHEKHENYIFSFRNKILIGTDSGIYRLSKNMRGKINCIKDPTFWPLTKGSQVFRAAQSGKDIICSQKLQNMVRGRVKEKTTYFEQVNNTYKINPGMLNRLNGITLTQIVYDSIRKTVFICANEGLFILNNKDLKTERHFNLILKEFITKNDTLLENVSRNNSYGTIEIPFKNNNVSITLGFTSFETRGVEFSYMIEGGDNDYSAWNNNSQITFDNLREGKYVVHVKARTELEEKIYELKVPFKILPPWYRSILAYIVYFLLFLAFVYVIVKLNSRRLISLNKRLEKTILDRTKTITLQKAQLEHKQTEIIDSINYAQRIQRALLASDNVLKKHLKKYFILFNPKDIVSGDFYWATTLADGNFALVTADSTGHGVPGAIMSMLNISCLEKATESEKLTQPNEILNSTRRKIIETLANDGSEEGGKDGMDCSFISFDFQNNYLYISAAYNPVLIVRQDTDNPDAALKHKLIEIKADKMPAGKHDKQDIPFSVQKIQIYEGDLIYTLTDGFADQFGGLDGKKFMSKNLKALLLQNAHLSLEEQSKLLRNTFENWKQGFDQVDDVTLIGIQV